MGLGYINVYMWCLIRALSSMSAVDSCEKGSAEIRPDEETNLLKFRYADVLLAWLLENCEKGLTLVQLFGAGWVQKGVGGIFLKIGPHSHV